MLRTATRLTLAATDLWRGIDAVDHKAAQRRVAAMRKRYPRLSVDELHRNLIYAKCIQTGVIGAVSGLTGLIPGVGKLATRVLGPLADATVVTMLQAELIAETFALYDVDLPPQAERMALVAIAATHVGAHKAANEVAHMVAARIGKVLAGPLAQRALPLAQVASTAVSNVAITYAIGTRAGALCKMRDAELMQWPDLIREVTMIDERRLTRWATGAARSALDQANEAATIWVSRLGTLLPDLTALSIAPKAKPKSRKPRVRAPAARKRKA